MKAVKVFLLLTFLVLTDSTIPSEVIQKQKHEPELRIGGGGFPAKEGQFQFMIFLMIKAKKTFERCSGSLVRVDWVLTAAHCTIDRKPYNILAVAGKADLREYIKARMVKDFDQFVGDAAFQLQERRVTKIYVPPYYNHMTSRHDLSLLWVNVPFILTKERVMIIPMSTNEMTSKTLCTILGWGMTDKVEEYNKLQFAENLTASTPRIGCKVRKLGPFICTSNQQYICSGDSGGPIVCDRAVWGVASYSFTKRKQKKECTAGEEDYFADLYSDSLWISNTISSGYRSAVVSFNCVFLSFFAAILSGYI